jgi:dTDP-3-amino-3,4,6-trideoxy-alpha-D-glucose transaminase
MSAPPALTLAAEPRPVTGVPFVALDRQHAAMADELRAAFERVVAASSFVLGAEVEAFERDFAGACGVRHAVGVASGTAALTLALLALNVGAGDEVIVPAHTFIASALGVVHAGATPVFCDVDEASGLIDPAAAEAAVSARTAAIVAVHLYGQVCDMDELQAVASRHDLALVEDAAQAHGATYRDRPAGSLGSVAAFSFYPSKNLGALGDGGAICTDDAAIAARARRLRNLGQRRKGEHVELGYNERLDGLQAAFLRAKLPHLAEDNRARRLHAAAYEFGLPSVLRPLRRRPGCSPVHHLFPVRTERRDELAAHLAAAGVQTGVHYFPAAHAHAAWGGRRAEREGAFPHAEAWARTELSLPMSPALDELEVDHVIRACRHWCATTRSEEEAPR